MTASLNASVFGNDDLEDRLDSARIEADEVDLGIRVLASPARALRVDLERLVPPEPA